MEFKGKAAWSIIGAIGTLLVGAVAILTYVPNLNLPNLPESKSSKSTTPMPGCTSANARIWTGVQVYWDSACSRPWAVVRGGNKAGQVLVQFPNGSEEFKDRDVVRGLYVKAEDPAIAAQKWYEFK